MMKICTLGAVCFCLLQAGLAQDEPKTVLETYPLGFADADLIVEHIKGMLSTEGKVVLDKPNNRILVFDYPERHATIKELVDKLQVVPQNVRIDVTMLDKATGKEIGVGLSVSAVVVSGEGSVAAAASAEDTKTTSKRKVTQFVTCMSGTRGFIQVGEEIPYVDWFMSYGVRHSYFQAATAWKKVGSRLVVEPAVIGDGKHVRVRVTPEFSYVVGAELRATAFDQLSTEVTVADGEEFKIGGSKEQQEFYTKFLVGYDGEKKLRTLEVILRPTILD
jgi:type II secretory pathway component GspD/PulD (secretin)